MKKAEISDDFCIKIATIDVEDAVIGAILMQKALKGQPFSWGILSKTRVT